MSIPDNYTVSKIPSKETYPWLLKKHYAHRIPGISFAFGLYKKKILCGVLTIGKPANPLLCDGVCGKTESEHVYELNRLCVNEDLGKNVLSYFVGSVLKALPSLIIVSYADKNQNHTGYIYQATNWLYTGLSSVAQVYKKDGKEMHSRSFSARYGTRSVKFAKSKGYEMVYKEPKHRYLYFAGNKKQKKYWKASLLYNEEPYPKGENLRYDASFKPQTQLTLFQ